ncbi:homeobox-leucine zipper protein GLABRA 2-like [Impatiens glandulifera]|uniref:homeobox-leucine zipper protein GLABRA 2-like n=1 Tax=Impatiens glandulifera TaxID=253017 RepID=UPI001FB14909|nr:homeobox-leucine zipper protein GLABRA 2-like [Impatiens glandulifera]
MGLTPQQVKFWFQDSRVEVKAIEKHNETSNMKTEMEKVMGSSLRRSEDAPTSVATGSLRQSPVAPATTPASRGHLGKGKEIVIGEQSREAVETSNGKAATARIVSDEEEDYDVMEAAGRKRKRAHRHSADQIRAMEILYSESCHPSESQRQELSNRTGLTSQQVKFWFQNRRTQSKAQYERSEISSMRNEMESLRGENKLLKDRIKKNLCFNCGFPNVNHHSLAHENELLIMKEIEKIRSGVDLSTLVPASTTSCLLGTEAPKVMELVVQATEELVRLAMLKESDWLLFTKGGSEIANDDMFAIMNSRNDSEMRVNISRETFNVFVDINSLVDCFMDVNQWKDMFPSIISKALTVDVICQGEGPNRNGAAQMMVAEFKMLSPIPVKDMNFIRHCRRLNPKKWVIVNFTINDNLNIFASELSKHPSGCIIEDISEGHCKVTWIEHSNSELFIPTNYPLIVNAAFSARHWATALQQQCEQYFYIMARATTPYESNVHENGGGLVSTMMDRTNTMLLAQKMTVNFNRSIAASNLYKFVKSTSNDEDEIRVSYKRNLNDPGEPIGLIICAVTSVWLPISRLALLDYLGDASHRHEWDLMMNGKAQSMVTFPKGSKYGNSVTIQGIEGIDDTKILQDSSSNDFESMLVFSSVSMSSLQSNYTGEVALLSSGFSILRNGMDSKELVLADGSREREHLTKPGEFEKEGRKGCLVTLAFQLMASSSPMDELSVESVAYVCRLVSFTLRNIKDAFKCE